MRGFLFSAVVAVLLFLGLVPPASAAKEWCTGDPPVKAWVDGMPVTVNVFVAVPVEYANTRNTERVSASVSGKTVTVTLIGPNAPFRAAARIASLGLSNGDPDLIYAPGTRLEFVFGGIDGPSTSSGNGPISTAVNAPPSAPAIGLP